MKSWRLLFTVISIVFFSSSAVWSQESGVLNVQFIQRADKKVEVTYDPVGDPSQKYKVKLALSKSGSRGTIPLSQKTLTEKVGKDVSPGRGLTIIWNLPDDYPQGLKGENFVFIV